MSVSVDDLNEAKQRDELVTRNIEECLNWEPVVDKMVDKEPLKAYWGTAPTGEPHLAYYFPLLKIRDMMQADINVTILLADVHSYMDQGTSKIVGVEQRTQWYEHILKRMLAEIGVDPRNITFIKGSEYQLDRAYCRDLYKMSTVVGLREAKRAASDVVKTAKNPSLSNLLYPLMQCLDETYLGEMDIQLGGRDQRKIFALSLDNMEKVGYKKCSYMLTPFIPGLKKANLKMSASCQDKICFSDSEADIRLKLQKAYCVDGDSGTNTNPIVALLKFIVFPMFGRFEVHRDDRWGGDVVFNSFEEFKDMWVSRKISGADVKPCLVAPIWRLVRPVQETMTANQITFEQ
jgi:tyrosyl-tRNA synthetase